MAQFSNCLSIISRMSERDQDALVSRVDELQEQGVPAQKAQVQAAIDVLMRAQADAAGIQRSAARDVTETPEFKRWSGGAPLVRLGESHEYRSGQPVVVEALHGTTNSDLTAFKRDRANIESDWGAGFYASNTPDDVATNYANNDGADLTQRIELLAERLASNEFDDDMDAAREEAKKRLTQESPNTMKLYVRMSNPAVQGGPGETFFDYNEEYNEETDEYGEPTGALVDFVDALRDAVNGFYESDADKAMAAVWDRVNDNGGIGLSDLVAALKSADGVAYATDDDGNIAASEIIRRALEGAGFDGIIDTTVSSKFDSMKGMDADTVHFIAFEPTQLKSATGNSGQFDPANPDVTRSAARQTDTPEFKRWFGDSNVVDADGKPLVVYHGRDGDFSQFNTTGGTGKTSGTGAFFSSRPIVADTYATGPEANVVPVYLSLRAPVIIDAQGRNWNSIAQAARVELPAAEVSDQADEDLLAELEWRAAEKGVTRKLKARNTTVREIFKGEWDYPDDTASTDDLARWVRKQGYDGVIIRNVKDRGPSGRFSTEDAAEPGTIYVAFRPEQIKSATGNNGQFDPNDADITRSVSRDTYAWRDSIDTSTGPLLEADGFWLIPQREIVRSDFDDGGFGDNGLLGHAERAVPGTRTIAYRIVGDNGIIGTLVSDVDQAGVLRSVHDIEITDRRGGIGSKIVATIAANTQSPIKIQDITDEADPFWTRIGVGYKDQYGDAFLDWEDVAQYLGARRAAQVDPDAAASEGRGRGLQEGSYEVSELSPEEAADFFKFSKPRVTELWRKYAESDSGFKFGRDALERRKSIADLAKAFSSPGIRLSEFDVQQPGGSKTLIVNGDPDNGNMTLADVNGDGSKFKIQAADATPYSGRSGDQGSRMYQALLAYAHNNNITVDADFSLTPVNELRRTSALLSSALRFGSTKHIGELSEQQGVIGWTGESFDDDVAALAEAELRMVEKKIPAAKQLEIDKNGAVHTNSEEVLAAIRDAGDRRESVDSGSTFVESRVVGGEDSQGAAGRQDGPGKGGARLRDRGLQDDVDAASGVPASLAEGLAELGGARIEDQELVDYLSSTGGGFGAHGVGLNTLKRALVTKAAIDGGIIEPQQGGLLHSKTRQIDTPAFKKWFGDSKVVDADGKPLVVYHGTQSDFSEFGNQDDWESSLGFHFGSIEQANNRISHPKFGTPLSGANVAPVYLSIQNPLRTIDAGTWQNPYSAWAAIQKALGNKKPDPVEFFSEYGSMPDGQQAAPAWRAKTKRALIDSLASAGYDGIVYKNRIEGKGDSYIAFHPEQIKSATGNNGAFDPNDANITRSVARPAFYSQLQRAIEQVPDRLATMAAPQWKLWLDANASKLGIKKDEIEWSGVKDYLTLRGKDKVTRDELVAYLADSGVRVQEVVLGNQSDRQKLSNEYDRAVAASDAAGGAMNPIYIESLAPGDRKPEEQALLDAWNRVNENPDESWLPEAGNPKYGQYTVPGGENYREVLITLPSVGDEDGPAVKRLRSAKTEEEYNAARNEIDKARAQQYKSSHWDAPNILAHLRVDDRTDADGNKVLLINEIQSDWGQDGKKNGFTRDAMAVRIERTRKLEALRDEIRREAREKFGGSALSSSYASLAKSLGRSDELRSAEDAVRSARDEPGVPRAPFVSDTKAWASLALKRAIMMAVEEGHDKIAIITGEQAADLYDLSKRVESVLYEKVNDKDLWEIEVRGLDGETILEEDEVPASRIEELIGKELAQKIINGDGEKVTPDSARDWRRLSGLDLKVGGEGMRAFYDQIIPQVARDVLKKLGGGQLQEVEIPDSNAGRDVVAAQVPGESMWGVYDRQKGQWLSSWEGETYTSDPDDAELTSEKTAKNMASAIMRDAGVILKQPGFDITPAMREKVASGVPLFSKGRTTGDYGREYTPQQLAMFKNTGRTVEKQSLVARVKEIRKDIWKKMAQGIVDQFRPIKDLGGDAYTLARLSKGSSGAFEALLNYGKLSIVDGAYDADMSGGFIKTVGEPLGAELEDWAWYVAANRAELLSAEDRENLFTPEDIAAGKSLATGQMDRDYVMLDGTVTRDRAKAYADSTKKFNAFNKNVLDIAEQSGLIDGESRQFWENEFYVPFYRVSDQDGEFMGAKIKGGLARQRAFQELKGGSQKLNSDLLANAMQNWAHLIDASAKNRAAKATIEAAERVGIAMESDQETVRQLGKSIGGKGGTVWFMDGGQQRHFLVGDPHLLVAINSLEYAGMRGPLMDALSTTKHWLTIGVTASPAFKVRNLIRDSLQAISVSDLSYNPLANLRDGIKASDRESQTYVSALASGGLIRFGTMLENNGAERVRRLVQKGVKPETILDSDDKLKAFYGKVIEPAVDAYNELGNRGEEINRAALFAQLKRQGMGQAEAALMARDLLDFSMQGTWTSIRFLTQVVPFLNARLQGLYVLGKGAAKNPQKFAITTGAVALASIALLAAYHDDEDWKKREDWDRDGNWWFKVGGVAYRIPKPFEIGAIGTLAERGVELFVNDEFTLKRFLERVKHIASDNLAMNPVPQAIKPMVDIYANKDSFSGRPIESMGMERLQAEYRYNANTSMVARAASTALNTVTRSTVGSDTLSPVQLDSLLRGYFGWLGTFIVAGADMAIRPLTNEPTRPQADYLKVVTQGIARQLPEPSSKYVSAVYDQAKILEQAYATHRQMIKEGKVEDAREFAKENREKLQRYKVVERVKQMQADINKRIREIERSEMSPEAKRYAIQKLREAQSRAAQLVY